MLSSAKTQDSTPPSSHEEPDPVKSQAYCFGARVPFRCHPEGLSPGGSAHQGLKPRGSDSLGLHKGKNALPAPVEAEMLFYAQQIRRVCLIKTTHRYCYS